MSNGTTKHHHLLFIHTKILYIYVVPEFNTFKANYIDNTTHTQKGNKSNCTSLTYSPSQFFFFHSSNAEKSFMFHNLFFEYSSAHPIVVVVVGGATTTYDEWKFCSPLNAQK